MGTFTTPFTALDGQVHDVWIDGGKIVAPPDDPTVRPARTLNASGLVVMPGGVDMHCHIAGPKVNMARKMRPEDRRRAPPVMRTANTHSGTMGSVPSTFATGYKYAGMGYTTAFDAAIPPLAARHAHEEFEDTPCIDKGFYVLMGNNHYVMQALHENEPDKAQGVRGLAARRCQRLRRQAGESGRRRGLESTTRPATCMASTSWSTHFDVTPRQIIRGVAAAADALHLPHPVHIHCNNLGMPGNWTTTLETMKALEGHRGHITHIQFHSYGGGEGDETTFNSKVVPLADYVNAHDNITVDVGQVLFGETTSMTGDGPLGYYLHNVYGTKWFSVDTEMESGCGIAPIEYRNKSLVHALQWAIGLEWYLLVQDPWRVVMSTDHPNGGSFLAYPQIIRLLMDRTYRQDMLKTVHPAVLRAFHAGRSRSRVHAERDLHHHPRRPRQDPGTQEQGTSGPRRRCRHHDLHAARGQGGDVRVAAVRDQERPGPGRGRRATRNLRRQDAARRAPVRSGHRNGHRGLVREVLHGAISQLSRVRPVPARFRDHRLRMTRPSGESVVASPSLWRDWLRR